MHSSTREQSLPFVAADMIGRLRSPLEPIFAVATVTLLVGLVSLVLLMPVATARAEQVADTKIALVLSGGGARGGAHVGVLRILEQQGIKPDLVVGTSFGALVGSLIAAGYSADEIEARLLEGNIGSLFNQLSPRETRSFRRKKDDDNLLVKLRLRLEGKNVTLPSALVSGHRLRTWLGSQYRHRATFADLQKVASNTVP